MKPFWLLSSIEMQQSMKITLKKIQREKRERIRTESEVRLNCCNFNVSCLK